MTEPSAAPAEIAPAAAPPEPATAEGPGQAIERIRASEAFQNERHPQHEATAERLSQVYRQLHGGPSPAPEVHEPLTEEAAAARAAEVDKQAWPFERPPVPEGHEWDELAEHALRALTLSHDVPVPELQAATGEYVAALGRRTMDPEARLDARDAALEQAWGDHVDLKFARAVAMAPELSPRLLRHASQAGMFQDAWIWLRLVEQWERKYR